MHVAKNINPTFADIRTYKSADNGNTTVARKSPTVVGDANTS